MTIETKQKFFFYYHIFHSSCHPARRSRWLRADGQTFVYITATKCLIINHLNVRHVACIKHVIFIRIKWKFIDSRPRRTTALVKKLEPTRSSLCRGHGRVSRSHIRSMNKRIHNSWLRKQKFVGVWPAFRERTQNCHPCFLLNLKPPGWDEWMASKIHNAQSRALKKVAERYMGHHVSYTQLGGLEASTITGTHRMWQRQIQSNIYEYSKHVGGGTTQTARVY